MMVRQLCLCSASDAERHISRFLLPSSWSQRLGAGSSKCSRSEQAGLCASSCGVPGDHGRPAGFYEVYLLFRALGPPERRGSVNSPGLLLFVFSSPLLRQTCCCLYVSGPVLSPHPSPRLTAWVCTCLVDTFVKPLTLQQ